MSTPIWPASLPQDPLIQGLQEQFPANTIRTQTDAGPAKVRRRFTAGVRRFPGLRMWLTDAQAATFDTFVTDTLGDGALSFEWKHPRTGETKALRFVEPPRLSADGIHWLAEMNLEMLP